MVLVVVLLSGKRYSGKDTAALLLCTLLRPEHTVHVFAAADACKRLYCAQHCLDVALFENRVSKEEHRCALTAFYHANRANDCFERLVAQQIAASLPRGVDVAIVSDWRTAAQPRCIANELPQVTCVRVRIEACDEARRARGWVFDETIDADATETALDDATFDDVVRNDTASLDDLAATLRARLVDIVTEAAAAHASTR